MRYEGSIYRPPSEAYSLIVQITIGCSHNGCTFCTMFKDKKFRVRDLEDVIEDLRMARKTYAHVEKIFLADGDALCLSMSKLVAILDEINKLFPECKQVAMYATPKDVLKKSDDELQQLKKKGVGILYIGAESGSETVLKEIKKGASRKEIIRSVRNVENAGIKASVTFISGIGGKRFMTEHARDTASMISEMQPSYVGLLTLMLDEDAKIYSQIERGEFELLTAKEVLLETMIMLKEINVQKKCVFRSNHASNYVSLRGDLPHDKEAMISKLKQALDETGLIKDERFRAL
ncbi:MAG: radical SAM protein [Eubacteriales bacterium]